MERQTFERLVRVALGKIPEDFRRRLENVDIIVEDWPSQDQLAGHFVDDSHLLLGLYEGVPLTERADYLAILPDRITIFQGIDRVHLLHERGDHRGGPHDGHP